ncbi:MAG TPA: hypothetical protein VFY23_12535 [Candidatus Limnocylindrales bacterium]|nr:hypothetical protein [Candidatus Limnocylindrales bacterium]
MAIIGPLFAFLGRFAGKVLNAALGWATILLFGKVPQEKQGLLLLVALGSIAWVVLVVGVIVPDVGTTLLAFVPVPDFIDEGWVRLGMLAAALVLPIAIGIAGVRMVREEDRPKGVGLVKAVARGYPFAAVLAVTIVLLATVALVRKGRSIVKRWEDAHIPVIVKPGGYDAVLDQLEDVLDRAGLAVDRAPAPRVLSAPPKMLDAVAGRSLGGLVPDRLMLLRSNALEVLVYPSDVAIQGGKAEVAQARAAIADRLTHAPAYLTMTEEAEQLEDRLQEVARSEAPAEDRLAAFDEIDEALARLTVPFDEWETLYRSRLQVERDVLASVLGRASGPPGAKGASGTAGAEAGSVVAAPPADAPRSQQLVGLAGMTLLAVYGVSLLLDRVLPGRRD